MVLLPPPSPLSFPILIPPSLMSPFLVPFPPPFPSQLLSPFPIPLPSPFPAPLPPSFSFRLTFPLPFPFPFPPSFPPLFPLSRSSGLALPSVQRASTAGVGSCDRGCCLPACVNPCLQRRYRVRNESAFHKTAAGYALFSFLPPEREI